MLSHHDAQIYYLVKYLLNFWNKNDEECAPIEECEVSETPFSRIVSDDNLRKVTLDFNVSFQIAIEILSLSRYGIPFRS